MKTWLPARTPRWKTLFSNIGFTPYLTGLFISMFGTGMNFAGVTLYVLGRTDSTVQVSFTVILLTLPRLIAPPLGGVLADRVDRRYLSITLDLVRATLVLGVAALAASGRLELWHVYLMVLLLGVGFAMYWAASLALLQELVPTRHLISANSAVLVAVQGGMLAAGATVGFVYVRTGLAGILAIDAATYALSAICFYLIRRGRFSPVPEAPAAAPGGTEPPPAVTGPDLLGLDRFERGPVSRLAADIGEGLAFLRSQPTVAALGVTYACMMAGVISANVVLVALAEEVLQAGARGYGFIQSGWALGAVAGGLLAGPLVRRRPSSVLLGVLIVLAVGNPLFPYAGALAVAVAMNVVFGVCRAVGAVLTQSAILAAVPRPLMGRTQAAFAALAALMQVAVSLTLGWLGEHRSLSAAFLLLGLLYGAGVVAAWRARALAALTVQGAPAA